MILLIAEITLAQHTTVASEHQSIAERRKAFGQTLAPDLIRGMRWKRPETHQNLIHPDKDLPLGITRGTAPPTGDTSGIAVSSWVSRGRTINADCFSLLRDTLPIADHLDTPTLDPKP